MPHPNPLQRLAELHTNTVCDTLDFLQLPGAVARNPGLSHAAKEELVNALNKRLAHAKPSATYRIIDRVAARRAEVAAIIRPQTQPAPCTAGKRLHTDSDVAHALLDEANVAVVHGSAFGLAPYLRIAYALDDDSLLHACEAIRRFCLATR
ncbi:aminotransferase class I/II-fold pyridoxal phosphate-dependent enzyme [Pseudomonas poae]|nr:aminotransferase class I/II-fold pyridoxal phosphate-dependent enzyme [Pseudomonas poae]